MTASTYNGHDMWNIFSLASRAVISVDYRLRMDWLNEGDIDKCTEISAKRDERGWVRHQIERFELHPVIKAAIAVCRPRDWHQLFLEWPHMSENDRSRIAYTQNEDKGKRDIQTVTSVGKYLTRHFDMPDHTIRDLVARYGTASTFKFVHTTAEMIYHLHKGPGSCMVWRDDRGVHCRDGVTRHPYEAYNPKYGWHMAVRIDGDETVGRALCMTNPDTGFKYFVRTYARPANQGGYSETDNAMENWLREQGYSKHTSWDNGERLSLYETRDDFLAPYLDGGDKRVSIDADNNCIVVDSDGEYACDQTGGAPTELSANTFECEDCGDDTDDDDGYWVGYNDDSHVCVSCYENDYVYGYGRNGRQYSFRSDDATYIESQSEYFHDNYLADNEIVELENGEYEHIENAIEVDGEWYHIDDERICRTEDTDEFLLCDNGCWQCEESGKWYTDSVDYVEVDDKKYHPDCAPATDDDDDEDGGDTAVAVDPVVATLVVPAPVVAKQLTIEMLNECALWEEHCSVTQRVTYSISIRHNGNMLRASRTYRDGFIASQGVDWMRVNVRRVLSNEILGLPASTFDSI